MDRSIERGLEDLERDIPKLRAMLNRPNSERGKFAKNIDFIAGKYLEAIEILGNIVRG